jgi:hypothetical protein
MWWGIAKLSPTTITCVGWQLELHRQGFGDPGALPAADLNAIEASEFEI